MTVAEQLKAARALIADRAHWCKGQMALNDDGDLVSATDSTATRRCAVGALYVVGGGRPADATGAAWDLLDREAARRHHGLDLADVNDRRGHAAVLRVYDAAIAAAEAEVC